MIIDNLFYQKGWDFKDNNIKNKGDADIVFVFGDRKLLEQVDVASELKKIYPNAYIVGGSSSGNIFGSEVSKYKIVASAVVFEKGYVKISAIDLNDAIESEANTLVSNLPKENLKHILLISDGLINGTELVKGANEAVDYKILITGGLAGDDERFETTLVIANEKAKNNKAVAVGFYGDMQISCGCYDGWSEFGANRIITKSVGNIVYEIDNQPALNLYKKYLGEELSKELPGSGLRFPFSIRKNNDSHRVIRAVLGINEEENSLIFAGDVPQGYVAQLMRTNIDGLIEGAEIAAKKSKRDTENALCIVVSCVARKIVEKDLTDEELESVQSELGKNTNLIGFYSYGELAPFSKELKVCELHNQTMTLTLISED